MDYRLALRPPGLVLGDTAEIPSCLSWCDTFVWKGRLRVGEARLVAQLILSLIFYSGFILSSPPPPPPADLTIQSFSKETFTQEEIWDALGKTNQEAYESCVSP